MKIFVDNTVAIVSVARKEERKAPAIKGSKIEELYRFYRKREREIR